MTRPWRIPSRAVRDAGPYAEWNEWPPPSTPVGGGGEGHGLWPGIAPSADGALNDRGFRPLRRAGVSRRARRGSFAGCGQREFRPLRRATGGAAPWTPRFWAARRSLARVVGEEFFVRARCGFTGILDVWQETAPRLWRKRPGEHRRHTGGGWPSQKKSSKTFICFPILPFCNSSCCFKAPSD